jgi:RimJ/RimL family protein N-acetyltransferase
MPDPADFSVIEILRNGRKVKIRALRPQDRLDLEAAISRMSDESLYRRFFGSKHEFTEKEVAYFLNIDFVNHVALVIVADENCEEAIVGGGRYVVVEPGRAEMAFAVIDEYQGQGLGAALMRELVAVARQGGISELIAEVLAANAAMLKVFDRSGFKMTAKREGSVVHVTLTLAQTHSPSQISGL